jgi:hypothetical protein
MTPPAPTPNDHASAGGGDQAACGHDAGLHDDDRPAVGDIASHGQHGPRVRGRGRGGGGGYRHGVGLSAADRATLTELIASAPLPPPHVLARLRGYLPPTVPD